jgi:glutamyl-tRNA(Gln) amidotransferase subunit E
MIPLKNKTVRIIQLSMEEDSCREISDIGHTRIYTTDRLGMPLIEVVTYPDMKTPDEAAEAAQYIRFLNRSTGKVRTGIGAAREDVNVSITGGTRIEIKGVSHISLIPELVHNEAFRQKSLLEIRKELLNRIPDYKNWKLCHIIIDGINLKPIPIQVKEALNKKYHLVAVNLPGFKNILSFFTQPGRMFSDEISDRLKVIACIEKPNMIHSEDFYSENQVDIWQYIRKLTNAAIDDAQILFWGPEDDIKTAFETIEERCRMAFLGVPNETRKSFSDGTTIFERVLPGADRMYPDTDSAPISINQDLIDSISSNLPIDVDKSILQLKQWNVPEDTYYYLLRYNLVPLIQHIVEDFQSDPIFVATLLAHRLKYIQGQIQPDSDFNYERIYELFEFTKKQSLQQELLFKMLPIVYKHPQMDFESVLKCMDFHKQSPDYIYSLIPLFHEKFKLIRTSKCDFAEFKWIMKELGKIAIGNIPLSQLGDMVQRTVSNLE